VSGLMRHRIWPWDEGMRENKTTKKEKTTSLCSLVWPHIYRNIRAEIQNYILGGPWDDFKRENHDSSDN